jgi:hypothetical protein
MRSHGATVKWLHLDCVRQRTTIRVYETGIRALIEMARPLLLPHVDEELDEYAPASRPHGLNALA